MHLVKAENSCRSRFPTVASSNSMNTNATVRRSQASKNPPGRRSRSQKFSFGSQKAMRILRTDKFEHLCESATHTTMFEYISCDCGTSFRNVPKLSQAHTGMDGSSRSKCSKQMDHQIAKLERVRDSLEKWTTLSCSALGEWQNERVNDQIAKVLCNELGKKVQFSTFVYPLRQSTTS